MLIQESARQGRRVEHPARPFARSANIDDRGRAPSKTQFQSFGRRQRDRSLCRRGLLSAERLCGLVGKASAACRVFASQDFCRTSTASRFCCGQGFCQAPAAGFLFPSSSSPAGKPLRCNLFVPAFSRFARTVEQKLDPTTSLRVSLRIAARERPHPFLALLLSRLGTVRVLLWAFGAQGKAMFLISAGVPVFLLRRRCPFCAAACTCGPRGEASSQVAFQASCRFFGGILLRTLCQASKVGASQVASTLLCWNSLRPGLPPDSPSVFRLAPGGS